MTRHWFLYVLFFCLLIGSTWTFAQNSLTRKNNDKKDNCSRYKMRVVTPSNEIDYKLRIAKPREDIDFKGKVINPCKKPEAESSESPSSPEKEKQK
jgi:hypothetical protein